MTPEELKAKELIEKFRPFAHKNFTMANDGEIEKAKQCAIICVREILASDPLSPSNANVDLLDTGNFYIESESMAYEFWDNVLTAIEKY